MQKIFSHLTNKPSSNIIRIEHGLKKGCSIGFGFSYQGSRITTSANRCILFNTLINRFHLNFENLVCADLCCGSGIIGIELLSCGAKHCTFIDSDKQKLNNVKQALEKLNLNGECVYSYLPSLSVNKQYDLMFFDPPYDNNFLEETIEVIYKKDLLSKDGMLILETTNEREEYANYKTLHVKELKNKAKFIFLAQK